MARENGSESDQAREAKGSPIQTYQDLVVWKLGMDLAVACYSVTKLLPKEELFGLTSQVRRSAASVPANIAEGYGREHRGEYIHFLQIAQGSLKETETHLMLTVRVGLMTQDQVGPALAVADETGRVLRALIRKLQVR